MNNPKTYSISEVSQGTGVSKGRIREWHEKGHLPDAYTISVGSRQHRRFNGRDIQVIHRINEFQQQGFILPAAAEKALGEVMEVEPCR